MNKTEHSMYEGFLSDGRIFYRHSDVLPGRKNLVFVHGLSGSSSAWLPFEQRFADHFNVFCIDLRGHGKSYKPQGYEDYALSKMAEDIDLLVNSFDIKKPVIVSHSFGTLVALEYIKLHQAEISGSIFLSPTSYVDGIGRSFVKPLLSMARKIGLFKPAAESGGHIDYAVHPQKGDWDIPAVWKDVKNTSVGAYLYSMEQSFSPDLREFLPEIKIPVLVMHGLKDTIFPLSGAVTMSKEIPNSKLVVVNTADHVIVKNNAQEVGDEMEKFLAELG